MHAIPQVQQKEGTATFLHVTLMLLSIFQYKLNNNFKQTKQ
jgi:hypothetical protein